MGFAGVYNGGDIISSDNAVNVIQHAIKQGVTFFDTSDYYGPHTNEIILGKVLSPPPFAVFVETCWALFLGTVTLQFRFFEG